MVCPAPDCFVAVDCTIPIHMTSSPGVVTLAGAPEVESVWLAEVALHMMSEHPELCEPAAMELPDA